MSIDEYEFPGQEKLEADGYCVFPAPLESDDLVVFHATQTKNLTSIVENGLKSAAELGGAGLTSVTFAYKSRDALTHLATIRRSAPGEYCILALRYDTLDHRHIVKNTTDLHDYALNPRPEVIGVCHVPVSYRHV